MCSGQYHGLKGHNELFINNGNGTFTESAAKYGLDFSGFSTQAVFFDYDHDGTWIALSLINQSIQIKTLLIPVTGENLIQMQETDYIAMI